MSRLAPLALPALLLGLLALAPAAAAAEEDDLDQRIAAEGAGLPVQVEVRLGLAPKTPRRGFVPVQVDLTARDEARTARVRLRPLDSETPLLELDAAPLEPGVPRRLRGLAPARLLSDCPQVLIEALGPDGAKVGVALAYPDPSYDRVLLVLDRRGAPPTDLSKLRSRVQLRASVREDAWLSAHLGRPDELPESPLAYTGVNAVLLGDMSFERWTATQAHALAGWVARGGHLIVSLGPGSAGLRAGLLGRALGAALDPLPVEQPMIPGSEVSLAGTLARFGDPGELRSAQPPTMARLVPGPDDRVVLRDDARPPRPFVVTRRCGAGQVTFVAADLWAPPFLHAAHTRRLLEDLIDPTVRYEPRSTWLFPKLAEIRQPTQIGPAFALLILFALIAGPGVYFLLRARKRGALLWVVIPALTVVFSLLVPFYRLALRKAESTLVGVRLVECRAGEALGVETIDALLFSGSTESKYLELKGEDAVAYAVVPPRRFLRGRGGGEPSLGAALGSAGSAGRLRCELPVALWGARYVSCERTARLRPTTGTVGIGTAPNLRVEVQVRYEGQLKLEDPVLVVPVLDSVQLHLLPRDLGPGAEYRARAAELTSVYDPEHEGLAAIVGESLVTGPLARQALRDRVAYLVGHTEHPAPLSLPGQNVRVRAFATLVVIELPLRYLQRMPFGAASPRIESSTVAEVSSQSLDRECVTGFQLPAESRGHAVRQLELRLSAARWATLRDASLEALHYASDPPAWRALDLRPARRVENAVRLDLELPAPAEWVGPDGEVRFRERFRRPTRADDADYTVAIELSADWSTPPPPSQAPEREGEAPGGE